MFAVLLGSRARVIAGSHWIKRRKTFFSLRRKRLNKDQMSSWASKPIDWITCRINRFIVQARPTLDPKPLKVYSQRKWSWGISRSRRKRTSAGSRLSIPMLASYLWFSSSPTISGDSSIASFPKPLSFPGSVVPSPPSSSASYPIDISGRHRRVID